MPREAALPAEPRLSRSGALRGSQRSRARCGAPGYGVWFYSSGGSDSLSEGCEAGGCGLVSTGGSR